MFIYNKHLNIWLHKHIQKLWLLLTVLEVTARNIRIVTWRSGCCFMAVFWWFTLMRLPTSTEAEVANAIIYISNSLLWEAACSWIPNNVRSGILYFFKSDISTSLLTLLCNIFFSISMITEIKGWNQYYPSINQAIIKV